MAEKAEESTSDSRTSSRCYKTLENKFVSEVGIDVAFGVTILNRIKYEGRNEPWIVRVNPSGSYWAVGFSLGHIRIFNANIEKAPVIFGQVEDSLEVVPPTGDAPGVSDIRFFYHQKHVKSKTKSQKLVAVYASGHIRIIEFPLENPSHAHVVTEVREKSERNDLKSEYNSILCVSVSYDNHRVITGGADCVIRVYDSGSLEILNLCKQSDYPKVMDGHAMRIFALMYHPSGERSHEYHHIFVSGAWDDVMMIWDDRRQQSLYNYYGPHVCCNDALDIDVASNNILVVNGSREKPMFSVYRFNTSLVNTELTMISSEKDYEQPVWQYVEDPHKKIHSMPYVGKWLTPMTLLIGGGNDPMLLIITKERSEVLSRVLEFERSIISLAIHRREKGNISVLLCSGTSVFVLNLDRRLTTSSKIKRSSSREKK